MKQEEVMGRAVAGFERKLEEQVLSLRDYITAQLSRQEPAGRVAHKGSSASRTSGEPPEPVFADVAPYGGSSRVDSTAAQPRSSRNSRSSRESQSTAGSSPGLRRDDSHSNESEGYPSMQQQETKSKPTLTWQGTMKKQASQGLLHLAKSTSTSSVRASVHKNILRVWETPALIHQRYMIAKVSASESRYAARRFARSITRTSQFDHFCALAILSSSFLVGAETEYMATNRGNERPEEFFYAQNALNVFFLVELFLRMVDQSSKFFYGKDWAMNWFDLVMVVVSVVDLTIEILSLPVQQSTFRTIRVLRVVRTLRITRELRQFADFRKMVFALQSSASTFLWSVVLMFFGVFLFAVTFTQSVAAFLQQTGEGAHDFHFELDEYYGTLGRSLYSLYMAISQGKGWGLLADPLLDLDWIFFMQFIFFIHMSMFGVLNVVTSVFVEAAMKSTEHYKELMMQESAAAREQKVKHIAQVFKQMDFDESGELTMEEMEYFLTDPELQHYLEALDITASDTRVLFRLLDTNGSGKVDIHEFCDGCMRLRGAAKSFDIHCIIYESKRMVNKWSECITFLERAFEAISRQLDEQAVDVKTHIRREVSRASQKNTDALEAIIEGGGRSSCVAGVRDSLFSATSSLRSGESEGDPDDLVQDVTLSVPLVRSLSARALAAALRIAPPPEPRRSARELGHSPRSTRPPGCAQRSDSPRPASGSGPRPAPPAVRIGATGGPTDVTPTMTPRGGTAA